jgi:acetyl esterase/lipase
MAFSPALADDAAAKKKAKAPNPSVPNPTLADVAYGPHAQQKLDFYKAESDKPTPLLFVIHGGGWRRGDKETFNNQAPYLKAGISVVSINYRFIQHGVAEKLDPPVKAPLHDAARALQFVRSKAAEWNLDKERIAATGSSAGACSSLWLAFHPDLADPKSEDPIARESTRLYCAAVVRGQTSLDPKQMREWIPNITYGPHAFGFEVEKGDQMGEFEEFLAKRETLLPSIKEYSPYELVTPDDPPVYLQYTTAPKMGQDDKEGAHSANFGVGLAEKLKKEGVEHELVYRGARDVKHPEVVDYVIEKLTGNPARQR